MKIINLTPHVINVHTPSGVISFPASGSVARVETKQALLKNLPGGIPVFIQEYGEVTGLPEDDPSDDGTETGHFETYYLVSALVRAACPSRFDLLSPGELVRDEEGNPVGCKGLVQNYPTVTFS